MIGYLTHGSESDIAIAKSCKSFGDPGLEFLQMGPFAKPFKMPKIADAGAHIVCLPAIAIEPKFKDRRIRNGNFPRAIAAHDPSN